MCVKYKCIAGRGCLSHRASAGDVCAMSDCSMAGGRLVVDGSRKRRNGGDIHILADVWGAFT